MISFFICIGQMLSENIIDIIDIIIIDIYAIFYTKHYIILHRLKKLFLISILLSIYNRIIINRK